MDFEQVKNHYGASKEDMIEAMVMYLDSGKGDGNIQHFAKSSWTYVDKVID